MRVVERVHVLPRQVLVFPGFRLSVQNPHYVFLFLCFVLSLLLIGLSAVRSSNYSLIVEERAIQSNILRLQKVNQLLLAEDEEMVQNEKVFKIAEKKLGMNLPEQSKMFIIKTN